MNRTDSLDFIELVEQTKRGRLRVYLGFAAGVGKTYRMLKEAHTLQKRGVDIVVGFVETHGRSETAAIIDGLKVIPRKKHEYRGIVVEEMDLDAVLARHPQVAIVDEVAHTNVPTCRNRKRYQDILELLDSGINVICAFNVQHLESLNDLVKEAADVKVRETIPDPFLKQADQVVTLDLTVEDLLLRLREGKIYDEDKIPWAREHFFKKENLDTLRELTLREVVENIERIISKGWGHEKTDGPLVTSDRVMVCVASASPQAHNLLSRGSRMAGRLNTHWFVVYVETPRESPLRIDAQAQRGLLDIINRAGDLGAEFVKLRAKDPVTAILDFANSHSVKHIVMGYSREPWWKMILGRSFLFRMLRYSAFFDLYIISTPDQKGETG
ncbi:MAG TPA: universal stress protein [Syntrophorhabdaceae bacterium]|nr:universal stress protein [Syntrophorhabdaceae bacterium]